MSWYLVAKVQLHFTVGSQLNLDVGACFCEI